MNKLVSIFLICYNINLIFIFINLINVLNTIFLKTALLNFKLTISFTKMNDCKNYRLIKLILKIT